MKPLPYLGFNTRLTSLHMLLARIHQGLMYLLSTLRLKGGID